MSASLPPRIIPELDVSDLEDALAFYVGVLGAAVLHRRPEHRFVYLDLEGAHLMLEEAAGPGRRFRTAPLERPFGRGLNLQIQVADARAIHQSVEAAGYEPLVPLEERWYRADAIERGNLQFVVADPDGYLLRFFTDLGERPL
jgi:catechol 2,3-dioxygenase-like lactoylglutathione lyase family enzyme